MTNPTSGPAGTTTTPTRTTARTTTKTMAKSMSQSSPRGQNEQPEWAEEKGGNWGREAGSGRGREEASQCFRWSCRTGSGSPASSGRCSRTNQGLDARRSEGQARGRQDHHLRVPQRKRSSGGIHFHRRHIRQGLRHLVQRHAQQHSGHRQGYFGIPQRGRRGVAEIVLPSTPCRRRAHPIIPQRGPRPSEAGADFHFRCLKRATKQARPDDGYLCDGRDLLISLNYKSIVQLVADRADGAFRLVWHRDGANTSFSLVDQLDIAKAYSDAISPRPGSG